MLDAKAFAKHWQGFISDREHRQHRAQPGNWRLDSKFPDAERGFAQGERNPVPLALVSCNRFHGESRPSIGFTNGITRTLWLLANGAPMFPVECGIRDGWSALHELAGARARPPQLLADLTAGAE